MQTADTPLIAARRRDVERRRARVHKAIVDMHSDGSEITIASAATRAGVHRSFIHRHADLHAAVLAAAAETIENPSPASTTISHRSVLTENANLHALNRRLAQRIRDLEDRLSEMLGQQAFERSGLGAPTATAAVQDELEHHRQLVLDLTSRIEELDEELAAAREANRGLMAELNRA
jgi:cell division protein FtsB